MYDIRKIVFSNQTGRISTRSQRGNKYIMVMVKIDSNAILVEPINSRNKHKLARAYRALMKRLQHAGIVPKKHILDNEILEATKTIIKDKYRMAMELVPPGCHRRNAGEVAIRNLKAHILSVFGRHSRGFSTFVMGPPPPPNRNNNQPFNTIQCNANRLSLRALVRTVRL